MTAFIKVREVAPIELEDCPGHLEWSAFGASYMDTACSNGILFDLDGGAGEVPCPWHDPTGFTHYLIGGTYIVPLCTVDEARLPDGTELHYHDAQALWWSANCPEHGEQRVLMRDFAEVDGFNDETFVPWFVEATGRG